MLAWDSDAAIALRRAENEMKWAQQELDQARGRAGFWTHAKNLVTRDDYKWDKAFIAFGNEQGGFKDGVPQQPQVPNGYGFQNTVVAVPTFARGFPPTTGFVLPIDDLFGEDALEIIDRYVARYNAEVETKTNELIAKCEAYAKEVETYRLATEQEAADEAGQRNKAD